MFVAILHHQVTTFFEIDAAGAFVFNDQLALPVAHGKVNFIYISRKDARRKWIHSQGDPTVLESAGVVERQTYPLPSIVSFEAGEQACLCEQLKPIANTDDELSIQGELVNSSTNRFSESLIL